MDGFLQQPPQLPDAWTTDRALREALRFHLGDDRFEAASPLLAEVGRWSTTPETLDLAMTAEREPPVHVPYSTFGERIDEIRLSDAYVSLGKKGVEFGVTAIPYEDEFGEAARV